ncbi:glycosyltransferase family 2 protein [Dongia sp.]|uniref:glycosyltransferase family 2 protein n=1 Tax=Dongia sp. TaxID=1977262 RepID=UPI003752C175
MPAVSVIIAALDAQDTLGAAIDSVLAQDFSDFEIVIAPDEPADYAVFARSDPRVRVLAGVPAPTGPGPARNRALAAAQGEWIALLDADDLWSPNYLGALMRAAAPLGAAFGRTSVLDENDRELRSIPPQNYRGPANFSVFARAFGSFHGITRRSPDRAWRNLFAEDVLFDMETLSLVGGAAPYVPEAVYTLRSRARSATRSASFIGNIGTHYATIIDNIAALRTMIGSAHRADAIAVFESWAAMNERFLQASAADSALKYQNYIFSLKL